MTALPAHVRSVVDRFGAIPVEKINAALGYPDDQDRDEYERAQSREGEDISAISPEAQVRALCSNPAFWEIASALPNNRLYWPVYDTPDGSRSPQYLPKGDPRPGAPTHFPDYLMFMVACVASISGYQTYRKACAFFSDPSNWAHMVHLIDQYAPPDWTLLHEIPTRSRVKQINSGTRRTIAKASTKPNAKTRAMPTNHGGPVHHLYPVPNAQPPQGWHFDNWKDKFYGKHKSGKPLHGAPLAVDDPYYGLRDRMIAKFQQSSIHQAQAMGLLQPGLDFYVKKPLRDQYLGTDGVVFVCKNSETTHTYMTGSGAATGTKFGITSTRVSGQMHSRVITDFANITKDLEGSYNDESVYVEERLPLLRDLSDGGVKGVLVDSAIRGKAVTRLQRGGLCVVNYPHAESNPDGGPGKRLNPTRREKTYLRRTITHEDTYGFTCEHPIFAVGGDFAELVDLGDGTDTVKAVTRVGYEQRGRPDNRREYIKIQIKCPRGGTLTERLPVFHDDPTSTDPFYDNWGEVCRVFAPGSPEFTYLYGQRNDTEARHAEIKRRIRYMPKSVIGQDLRLLGACVANNALSWQVHLQAHDQPNVIDNTA